MKKKFLWSFLLAGCACALTGILSLRSIQASADTAQAETVSESTISWLESDFVMDYGASVRVGTQRTDEDGNTAYEGYGIRFSVTAEDETAEAAFANLAASDAVMGVIIAPYSTVKNVTSTSGITDKNNLLTAKTVFEDKLFTFAEKGEVWTDNSVYNVQASLSATDTALYGAIINLNIENFLQKYTGVAYVGVPKTYTESGEVATYTYYFAKYASGEDPITGEIKNDVSNNTRCMYYVAQRAVETGDANATALQASYIDEFASNEKTKSVANDQKFKYTVVHHYVDENSEETLVQKSYGATLAAHGVGSNNPLGAPIETTYNEKTYDYDINAVNGKESGYLYAGSMTYLHVYYTVQTEQTEPTDNQTQTKELLTEMGNNTETYFGGSMEVVEDSNGDPTLSSANADYGWLVGQDTVEFTAEFVNTLISEENKFTKLYIETATIKVEGFSAIGELLGGNSIVVDTIEVTGCVTQTLDASVVGYEANKENAFTATITFGGIVIELPTETVTDGITLTAKVGEKSISGTWTLTGLLFG